MLNTERAEVVIERARLTIIPGEEASFEAAFLRAAPLFLGAKGCTAVRIERVIEMPSVYVLVVDWQELGDHLVHFRGSDAFQEWRRLVSPHFAQPPEVEHLVAVKS